jgi:hypothetical protein
VPARGHVALAGFAGLDVDDTVEEVGFAVLATEVLSTEESVGGGDGWKEPVGKRRAYAGYDLVVVGEVRFAGFAAVDLFGVEVDVVGEAHGGLRSWGAE